MKLSSENVLEDTNKYNDVEESASHREGTEISKLLQRDDEEEESPSAKEIRRSAEPLSYSGNTKSLSGVPSGGSDTSCASCGTDIASGNSAGSGIGPPSQNSDGAPEGEGRARFGSDLQFILTCIGYSVGLGNIWRFPSLAYENGGGAFLLPYVMCSVFFGFPLLYFELCVGQYLQGGPSVVFYKYMPVMQGIGWCMALISASVGIYYNVIVAWVCIYIYEIVTGQSSRWVTCDNEWNTEFCQSSLENSKCAEANSSLPFYFNGECFATIQNMTGGLPGRPPAEEFFERYVLEKTDTVDEFGGMNWKIFGALACMWVLVALGLWKGVKYIGKISLVTATVPYLIIGILFFRGITLDGADIGLDYYLLKPDFSYLFKIQTWKAALTQVCFSLSIGFGGLLSMSSYNDHKHNSFKDAVIVVFADSFMSLFGGVAVFTTLGYLSKQQGVSLDKVVQSGTSLAFVAYPEAMGRMPVSWVWSFLFFLMLFILGISTQFVYTETMATSIVDAFPHLQSKRVIVTTLTCLFMFIGGLVMATRAGIFWFNIFNDFCGSFSVCLVAIMEVILVIHLYGAHNYILDLRSMFGHPRTKFGKWFGRSGQYFKWNWTVVSPLLGTVVLIFTLIRDPITYGKDARLYTFPPWTEAVGWSLAIVPTLCVPIFFVINLIKFNRKGKLKEAFKVQPEHRSYGRTRATLATCVEGEEEDYEPPKCKRCINSMMYNSVRTARSGKSRSAEAEESRKLRDEHSLNSIKKSKKSVRAIV